MSIVFGLQAAMAALFGGLAAFNVIFPSEDHAPSLMRAWGMWSVWLSVIPPLRARSCNDKVFVQLAFLLVAILLTKVTD